MSYEIKIVGRPQREGTATSEEIRATLLAIFGLLERREHYVFTLEGRTPMEGNPGAANVYSVNVPDANHLNPPIRPAATPRVYEQTIELGPGSEKKQS